LREADFLFFYLLQGTLKDFQRRLTQSGYDINYKATISVEIIGKYQQLIEVQSKSPS
jgi:hypothetical protein